MLVSTCNIVIVILFKIYIQYQAIDVWNLLLIILHCWAFDWF